MNDRKTFRGRGARALIAMAAATITVVAASWAVQAAAEEPAAKSAELVKSVEAQPLLAQMTRLQEALVLMGRPLPSEAAAQLRRAADETGDARVTALVQEALDPLCLAAVHLDSESRLSVSPLSAAPELLEQGWSRFLIKVHNEAASELGLHMRSPNAQAVPGAPADDVAERWLDLALFNDRPLEAKLGGLELEYRVVQLFSRDAGPREAVLEFNVYDDKPTRDWVGVPFAFECRPSKTVAFHVLDDKGQPTTTAFVISDDQGRVYPAQAKRLAPDFFFHPQIYRASGETVRLPAGVYTVLCSRGPESEPETKQLVVRDDDEQVTLEYQVRRWVDPASLGWWSGDHHIHAAGCQHYTNPTEGVHPLDMARQCIGEDLKVGCALTWGPCFDYQKQFFTGAADAVSEYPYLLRYDIEVSGFGSHRSGHLCLLRLKEQIYPGGDSKDHWPTLGLNTLRWAKRQGAITGPAHSASGLVVRGETKRVDGVDGPNGLPNFQIPPYDGIGANEYIVDITHEVPGPEGTPVPAIDFISTMDTDRRAELNMWYHTLNCGFRVRVSGETDFPCISGQRVGMGRVYVKVDGPLDYDTWCEQIRNGRSYVSDGSSHLMDFRVARIDQGAEERADVDRPERAVAVGERGSELALEAPGRVRLTALVAARIGGAKRAHVEALVNGYPVAVQPVPADGTAQEVSLDIEIERSSWVALRIFPSSHTNPVFVIVDRKPIRASRASARWCLEGVDQCWSQKARTYRAEEMADAEAAYEHARAVYRKILDESPAEPVERPSD